MQDDNRTGAAGPPGDQSGGTMHEAKGQASHVVSEAKEQASRAVDAAKEQARGVVEERKMSAAEQLDHVAGALREAAHKLEQDEATPIARYATGAADQVDRVARYLKEKDLQGLTRDAETFARRHPELFLGGAFLTGILAARFLKSSTPRSTSGMAGGAQPDQAPFEAQPAPFNPPHFEPTVGQ